MQIAVIAISPLSLILLISISVIVCFLLIRFAVRRRGEAQFRKSARDLTEKANAAKEELEELFVPIHLTEDADIADFRESHQALIDAICALEGHKYFNDDIFEETGIASFKSLLADSQSKKEENNKVYSAIRELQECATVVMENYRTLVHPAHYFCLF